MKYAFLIGILLALPLCSASVVISEVMINPIGSEYDNEYIVLYNDGPSVNISDWIIKTSSSNEDATLPNVILTQNSYFKIADVGYNQSADYFEEITLGNIDGGVSLIANGNIIDSVGWGDAIEFVEGSQAIICDEGQALFRIEDTDDNSLDFSCTTPSQEIPDNSNSINVELAVISSAPVILSAEVEDEAPEKAGVQVYPIPGEDKIKQINIEVSHYSDYTTEITFDGNTFDGTSFSFPFTKSPGNYSLIIQVCDTECTSKTLEIIIEEVIAFDLDTTLISLGGNMGGVYQLVGDLEKDTHLKPTITNLGNVDVKFVVSSTGLLFNDSVILPENIGCAITTSVPNEFMPLPYVSSTINRGLSNMMSFEFNVPSTKPGVYKGEVLVKATK